MVAVGAGVGEHVHPAVPDLDRQGVGVGVRGDAEEAVRAAVAAAPDLRRLAGLGAQQRSGRRRRSARAAARAAPAPGPAGRRPAPDQRAGRRPAARAGHQPSRPNSASPSGQQRGPAVRHRGRRAAAPRPSSPSPCRGGRSRSSSSAAARRPCAQQLPWSPGRAGRRRPRASAAASRPSSSDEAVVVGGQLAVQAASRRCCAPARAASSAAAVPPPARRLGEPGERAAGRELPGRLGDDVVVGRGTAAAEGGQALLVPVDLGRPPAGCPRTGRPGPRPVVEQPPDPDPG